MNFIVSMPLVADVHPVHTYRCVRVRRRNGTIRYVRLHRILRILIKALIPWNDLPVHVGGRVRGLLWAGTVPIRLNTRVALVVLVHVTCVLGFTPRLDVLYTFPITL